MRRIAEPPPASIGLELMEVTVEASLIPEIIRNKAAKLLSGTKKLDCSVFSATHGGIEEILSKPAKAREMRFILF